MSTLPTPKQAALAAVKAAVAKGALEPVLIDVSASAAYTDYVLIVSTKNTRQGRAIAEIVKQKLQEEGVDPLGVEGDTESQWRLLDFGVVVVHVFFHPLRTYYDLEGLWSEAPRVELDVPPAQRVVNEYF